MTYVVGAAMHAELSSEDDASDETEDRRDAVHDDEGKGDSQRLDEGGSEAVQHDDHGDDGDEHGEVDARGVPGECIGDDVTQQRQREQCPDESPESDSGLRDGNHFDGCYVLMGGGVYFCSSLFGCEGKVEFVRFLELVGCVVGGRVYGVRRREQLPIMGELVVGRSQLSVHAGTAEVSRVNMT